MSRMLANLLNREERSPLPLPPPRASSPDIIMLSHPPPKPTSNKSSSRSPVKPSPPESSGSYSTPLPTTSSPEAHMSSPIRPRVEISRLQTSSTAPSTPSGFPQMARTDGDISMAETVDDDDEQGGEGDEDGESDEEEEPVEGVDAEEGSDEDDDDEEEGEDDDEETEVGSEDLDSDLDILTVREPGGSAPPIVDEEKPEEGSLLPAGEGEAIPMETEAVNTLVPKKRKARRRSMSEDEDLPPPPPPMRTIRLKKVLPLDGQTLMWNILEDARERGMVDVWIPPEEKEDGPSRPNESAILTTDPLGSVPGLEVDEQRAAEELARQLEERYAEKPKRKKKKAASKKTEEYNLDDPFIDDSELLIDAPTHFGRPKKEGFYVHSGKLELLEESPVKPKAKPGPRKSGKITSGPRRSLAEATALRLYGPPASQGEGTPASPIQIDDEEDGPSTSYSPVKPLPPPPLTGEINIDRSLYKHASRDLRFLPPFPGFPVEVRERLRILRAESSKHPWDVASKGKFPEHLKEPLRLAGQAAFRHNMFNDREDDKPFFLALPSLLPYNNFTLTKLVVRLCHEEYWNFLQECEKTGLEQLQTMVDEEKGIWVMKFEESRQMYETAVKEYDEKQTGVVNNEHEQNSSTIPSFHNGDEDVPAGPGERPREPTKKFSWTPDMRTVLDQLLDNMQDMLDLNKRLAEWNVSTARSKDREWTETATKSRLYKKACHFVSPVLTLYIAQYKSLIVDCFPEGFASSNTVSREMTKVKRTKDKAQTGGE
ncbi:hypothetical protein M231_03052 [Tremella mesenterica]|uniref:Ubinuclein middle domain-containing protein n=1 Tax=Tremella mesenterica TaxID=5217 RepID=A0A4V1M4A6_TREME|nr:hypothetical protein M231_03052 [Tremella mesenterica]